MLEWLKNILGDAYSDEIDKKVSEEIGKGFVAKTDYNTKNEAFKNLEAQMRERDAQLEDLTKSTGDAAALKEQITALQMQNTETKKTYEAELARVRLDGAVEAALTAAGAKNNIAVKALLADFLKNAKLDESGAVKGLAAELKSMADSEATSFLFNAADDKGQQMFRGMQPGAVGGKTPQTVGKEPKDMNYDELCSYLEANPGAKL